MQDHDHRLDENEGDERSRGEQLLDEIKRNRVTPGQFRMGTLLIAVLVISVLLALPRIVGWPYEWFFGFLWISAFALSPLIAFSVTGLVPNLQQRSRAIVAVVCIASTTIPVLIYAASVGEAASIPRVLFFTTIWFWLPQIICIWFVWYFLFRKTDVK